MESLNTGIILLFAALQLVSVLILFKIRYKIYEDLAVAIKSDLLAWFSTPENQEAIAKNVQNLIVEPLKMATLGQLGGITKGISHQLKGMENDLIADGIDAATGFPIGAMATKYLEKYPVLKMFLPMLLKQGQKGQGFQAESRQVKEM